MYFASIYWLWKGIGSPLVQAVDNHQEGEQARPPV